MKPIIYILTWRYITEKHKEKSISTMTLITFFGILIGSCALALVMCIMKGFETTTYQKMRTMHAPIIMSAGGKQLDTNAIHEIIKNEFPEVITISPHEYNNVLFQDDEGELSSIITLKGVDPKKEPQLTDLTSMISSSENNSKDLTILLKKNRVLVGKKLASQHALSIGDRVELLFPDLEKIVGKKITLQTSNAHITGFFHTGIEIFDSSMIICSLDYLHNLFDNKSNFQLAVAYKKDIKEKELISKLSKRFKLEVISWKELYPALIAALTLEKYAMFLILALISLVASMNMMSLLYMFITRHRADIAILKAHGMTNRDIEKIYLNVGILISTIATFFGLLIAFLLGLIIEKYPFIQLPDVYYVSHLPISLEPWYFVLVFFVSLILSFIAIVIPLRSTKLIKIAYVLRQEA
ncbi:MAG TPA: FtsX-like permease family protein [Candidatus Babeliales bacterium]|nr:FtsX-like permease family protein [Candidatus Babeliales bacterium]